MKKYIKPTFEAIELRIEERLAHCGGNPETPGYSDKTCPVVPSGS
jgi:hypothetical protein